MCISCFFVRILAKRFSKTENLGIMYLAGMPNLSGNVRGRRGTLLLIDCPGAPWRKMGKGDIAMRLSSGVS